MIAGWVFALLLACVAVGLHLRLGHRLELVARAAHELRGPLTAAGLALESGSRDPRRLAAAQLELRRAGLALGDLDAAREGRSVGDRFEVVELGELCRTQLRAWQPVARSAGVALRCTQAGQAHVLGDAGRLAQATGNLVANALEHGRGDVEVLVCVRHGCARVEVSDGGPGIASQPGPPSRGRRRRGRGLTITAAIAGRHGGRLAMAPAAGGTTMALELPLAPGGLQRAAS